MTFSHRYKQYVVYNNSDLNIDLTKSLDQMLILIKLSNFSELNNLFGFSSGNKIIDILEKYLIENHSSYFKIYKSFAGIVLLSKKNEDLLNRFISSINEIVNNKKVSKELVVFKNIKIGISTSTNSSTLLQDAIRAIEDNKEDELFNIHSNCNINIAKKNFILLKTILDAINEKKGRSILPYYQPIVNNRTKKIEKFEALIRIKDARKSKILNPVEFLPFSKQIKLYHRLTISMVDKVMKDFENINESISFNISFSDIKNQEIRSFLYEKISSFPRKENITFEILEDEKIEDDSIVVNFIKTIKHFGCKVSIDDFGSGYSNFEQILKFNVDYIKIDGSIIKKIDDSKTYDFIRMITEHGKKFNIKIVAEFIENEEVLNKVNHLGIECSQGYYLYKPMSFAELQKKNLI